MRGGYPKQQEKFRPGRRSTHQRCPGCKKVRQWWARPNEWHPGREKPAYVSGLKVCWLCVKRAKEQGLAVFPTKETWDSQGTVEIIVNEV